MCALLDGVPFDPRKRLFSTAVAGPLGVMTPEEHSRLGTFDFIRWNLPHRPELSPFWDFSIFIRANFNEILKRACIRDADIFGSQEEVRSIYRKRYIPGQILYLNTINPAARADTVLDNNDIKHPYLEVLNPSSRASIRKD